MIGKFDKKRKEQKALLKELESIKSLLDDGELIDDDFSDLAETALKKSADHIERPIEHFTSLDDDDEYLISDDLDIDLFAQDKIVESDIPTLEVIIDDNSTPPLAPGVLPGQQSLFNENKTDAKKAPNTITEAPKETRKEVIRESATKNAPKATVDQRLQKTENPFLPPHIRERLGSSFDIPAYANPNEIIRSPYIAPSFQSDKNLSDIIGNNVSGNTVANNTDYSSDYAAQYRQPAASQDTTLSEVNSQQIIDALVNEFMPKIESRLRLHLAKTLENNSKK